MAKKKKTKKKSENGELQKRTLQDLRYGNKHGKNWKIRNAQCRTWNMARKQKNVENETQTLYDLECGKKH